MGPGVALKSADFEFAFVLFSAHDHGHPVVYLHLSNVNVEHITRERRKVQTPECPKI